MLLVRLTTCLACLLLVSCADLVGVEDWTPMPISSAEAGIEAPDGTTTDVAPDKDGSLGDTLPAEAAPGDAVPGKDAWPEAEASMPCQPLTWRCSGAVLQSCGASGWETAQVCETSALCSAYAGKCEEPVCAPGEYSCDAQKLMLCNAGRDGWVMKENCKQELVCDAAKGRCATCVAGSMACQGADLLVCTDDGQGMQVLQTCATGEVCDATLGICGPGPDN